MKSELDKLQRELELLTRIEPTVLFPLDVVIRTKGAYVSTSSLLSLNFHFSINPLFFRFLFIITQKHNKSIK